MKSNKKQKISGSPEGSKLSRRTLVMGLAGLGIAGLVYRYWPEDGFINPRIKGAGYN